jgi:hypothetical protein
MADKHPYVQGPGALASAVTHFRRSFPATVDAKTLKKLGIAPNNESYVLNVLRFLGLIDQEGKRTDEAKKTFTLHEDDAFASAFANLVKTAYSDLFELHGDAAWDLDQDSLITFFRSSDETTATVGKLQASTFRHLAGFSGHGDVPEARTQLTKVPKQPKAKKSSKKSDSEKPAAQTDIREMGRTTPPKSEGSNAVGLTVRIEVNLPADGSQATYDRIFKSIRENLLNG